jgi:hypothetical protein
MATSRREIRRSGQGHRRLGFVELSLTLCVIVGLLFVSLRIMSMGLPDPGSHAMVIKAESPAPEAPAHEVLPNKSP